MFFIYRSDQKIGIDLHGVIDHDVPLFKEILAKFIGLGKEIWIISGPPKTDIEAELEKYGLKQGEHYHIVASVVDYLKNRGVRMWLDGRKTWWTDEEAWWSAKGNICKENGISILIDDHVKYSTGIPKGGYIRLLIYDRHGLTLYEEDKNERKPTDN